METPKTEIDYGIICSKMPNPQSHYPTYELAAKCAKMQLPFDNPMYVVKRTTTYEICGVIGKKGKKKEDNKMREYLPDIMTIIIIILLCAAYIVYLYL